MTVGERIKAKRKARGMTLAGLAERIGRHKTTVLRFETGALPLRVDELAEIAKALGCDVRSLLPPRRAA